MAGFLVSCQSDARNATRIPPTPSEKLKSNWQKDAIDALTNNIRRKIDLDNSYFKRARIYFENEQYDLAINDINDAIENKDNVGDYYLLRGQVNRELNNLDAALQDAQRAEALQQVSPELYILMADILQEKKRFREAQNYLNRSLQMAPYDGSAYYVKGMLQSRIGDTTASLGSFKQAIDLNPRLLRAYQQNIIINNRLGNLNNALYYNNLALKRYPKDAILHFERGQFYNALNKSDSALLSYNKAAALDPKLTEAYFQSGSIYLKWKMHDAALKAFEKVKNNQAEYPQINYLIGVTLERMGYDDRASEFYKMELEKSPENQLAYAGVVRLQRREMGQYSTPSAREPAQPSAPTRILDTNRVQIRTIQPRRSIDMGTDTTRKVIIR
ncbi:tetratricopeptide repeat protein [Telluribacter sp.]|jgi:tetratricopeptide (TPR) repeat protein|uniref:tetratricopeptide repeat protein n=1 Tax=Telluribacter sp. TaxID=1978767 RepID=UPI002E0FE4CA|nr:tetratricopeptide repeat protein [Telluribacter sp.]